MSANRIEDQEVRYQSRRMLLPAALQSKGHKHAFELTRHECFIEGSKDIFDLLEEQEKK